MAEYLRGRRTGVTAEALATRFSVTLRTVYRDLDSLRSAQLPLQAERGRGGGYALDRAYTLPPINLSPREAALLVALGNFATRMRLLPFTETLAAALDKVRGALSTSAQRELLVQVDAVQFIGVPALPTRPAVRQVVEQAWFEQRPLTIRYAGRNYSESTRTIRIISVVLERSLTLLNTHDLDLDEPRQFRLDRIVDARLTETNLT